MVNHPNPTPPQGGGWGGGWGGWGGGWGGPWGGWGGGKLLDFIYLLDFLHQTGILAYRAKCPQRRINANVDFSQRPGLAWPNY